MRRVPQDEPLEDAADGVDGRDLQVAPVDVAQVVRDAAVDRDLARVAAAHVVIGAFHDGCAVFAREGHGTVLRVVDDVPDAGACFDLGLVAVRVKGRDEGCLFAGLNRGVLVQVVGVVGGGFFRGFLCRLAVADVIVAVAVGVRAEGGRDQFAAVVVREGVVLHAALPGGAAVGRASEGVIAVAALDDEGAAAVVLHAGEQVAVLFIALREREPVRLRQGVQEVRAAQVAVAELTVHAAVHEAGGGDAAVCSITHTCGELRGAGAGVGEAGAAAVAVLQFGDEVRVGTGVQRVALLLAVFVVGDAARAGGVGDLGELAEDVVGEALRRRCFIREADSGELAGGGVIAQGLDDAAGVGLGGQAVKGVVGLDDLRVIRVGLAEFDTGGGVVGPGRGVAVRALARVGGDVAAVGPEGGERGQVVGVVVAEESRLDRGAPFGDLAAAEVVFVAGGFALGVGSRLTSLGYYICEVPPYGSGVAFFAERYCSGRLSDHGCSPEPSKPRAQDSTCPGNTRICPCNSAI